MERKIRIIVREILIYTGILLAALLLSFDDWAPGDRVYGSDCTDLYDIIDTEIDQDGNTLFTIYVHEIDGSDTICLQFGRCVYNLIGSATGMGAVEIINFYDYWVPSKWQWIDSTRAAVLADKLDIEEYSWLSSYEWTTERTD